MNVESQRVGVFVDVPNLWVTALEAGARFEPAAIAKAASGYGRIVVARAYAAVQWGRPVNPGVTDLERAGFEAVTRFVSPAEGNGKDIDTQLAVDLVATAYEGIADILVLASSDADYVPAILKARRLGTRVVLVQYGPRACARLVALADDVITIPLEANRPPAGGPDDIGGRIEGEYAKGPLRGVPG